MDPYIELNPIQSDIMDLKIFDPYFINYRTILEYKEMSTSLSINDIIKHFGRDKDK